MYYGSLEIKLQSFFQFHNNLFFKTIEKANFKADLKIKEVFMY